MTHVAALGILLVAAGWLVFVGIVAIARPAVASGALSRMGSTWPIHAGEHVLRAIVGGALVVRADVSEMPFAFSVAGWFLILSSALIVLAPRRWHHAFSAWWADRISDAGWRLVGVQSTAAAAALASTAT